MCNTLSAPVIATLVALLFWAPAAAAKRQHSFNFDYRIDVPNDWARVPDSLLQPALVAAKGRGAGGAVVFDTAFQPASNTNALDYPFLLVQVLPYRSLGVSAPIQPDRLEQVMNAMVGQAGTRGLQADAAQLADAAAPAVPKGKPQLDAANRRYWVTSDVDVPGRGKVRAMLIGYFGPEDLVQLCYYAPAAQWDAHRAAAREITTSLRFEAPKPAPAPATQLRVVTPPPAKSRSEVIWESVRTHALRGAAVGGIGGALAGGLKALLAGKRKDGDDA